MRRMTHIMSRALYLPSTLSCQRSAQYSWWLGVTRRRSRSRRGRRGGAVEAGVLDMFTRGLKGLFSKEDNQTVATEPPKQRNLFFSNNAPSWEELETIVKEKGTQLGDRSLTQDDYLEVGPPNPLSLKRTFGKSEPIRVKLYRDHAGWCPYCQKVWIQLEEKQIPYTVEKINMRCYGDKPESFFELSPSGLLPVMEFDGQVFTESVLIADLLETEFPEIPLLPPKGSAESVKCSQLLRLERTAFSAWLQWLCRAWAPQQQKASFEGVLREIEQELAAVPGPYFLGEQFSLVDIVFAPFLERMDASLTFYKGYRMRGQGKYPCLEKWFEAMESRPTYIATRSDYYTHAFALPPQLGGCAMTTEGEPFAELLCGEEGGTWHLPLEPLSATSLEPYSLGDDPPNDTYTAAKKLISNHEAILKFALRACGKVGSKPVTAPLSDPTAEPGLHALEATDAALRHVVHALLVGVDEKQAQPSKLTSQEIDGNGVLPSESTIDAVRYLRDHIGVPRDMKFPEARQLRAHLNWMIDHIA